MPVDIRVPDQLGESVVEATVGRWHKREGDRVSVGENVVELETDKVNLEVSADRAGVIGSILKPEGETVRPGETLGTLEEAPPAGEPPRPAEASAPAPSERPAAAEPSAGAETATPP